MSAIERAKADLRRAVESMPPGDEGAALAAAFVLAAMTELAAAQEDDLSALRRQNADLQEANNRLLRRARDADADQEASGIS